MLLAALLMALAPGGQATDEGRQGDARLLSFDEVEARLGDPDFRLLDVRPREAYDAGHLPGAVWVDAKAVEETAAEPGALEDPSRWEGWVAGLGLGPETAVYVYDANRQKDAARFWWLLSYLGVEEVGLINGGFPLWQQEGRPVSADPAAVEPRPFPVRLRADRYANRLDVLEALRTGSARIVDARSAEEHSGERALSERGGRVPTSCHVEWASLVDEQGRFLPAEEVRPRLRALGLRPGSAVITHCQGGGRASVDAFVLRRLGFPSRNYYLGWSDWGNADDTPVETGAPAENP